MSVVIVNLTSLVYTSADVSGVSTVDHVLIHRMHLRRPLIAPNLFPAVLSPDRDLQARHFTEPGMTSRSLITRKDSRQDFERSGRVARSTMMGSSPVLHNGNV